MRIGIDGGALSISDDRLKVGVHRVARNLIKEFSTIGVKNDYRVYGFGRGEEGVGGKIPEHIHFVTLPRSGYQLIWQTVEIARHPIDVYLGISQSVPYTLYDVRKIGFIYDVAFLDYPHLYPDTASKLTSQTSRLVSASDHIITISQASAARIMHHYPMSKDKLTVSYLGVEKIFKPNGRAHTGKHPYFLFVGAFKPGKNIPSLLSAFAKYLSKQSNTHDLLLVGSNFWLDSEIADTIRSLGLEKRVHVVGFVDDAALGFYYRGATALLSLSITEGFGLPVVEAMACGTPVIITDTSVHKEIAGKSAYYVKAGDLDSVVSAMQEIAGDANLTKKMGKSGIVRAAKYTWRSFAKSVLAVTSTPKEAT